MRLLIGLVCALALTACAQRPGGALPQPSESAAEERTAVPQLVAVGVAEADMVLTKAGFVPILRFEPGVVADAGTVVNTEPPVGTMIPQGGTVTVFVAGKPGDTLHDYVDAHREVFVGVAADANGVLVVGVIGSADLTKEMATLSKLAKGAPFRVQTCSRSWVDLKRVQVELAKRKFLPGADKLAFATSIDPLACAVRMTVELPDAQIAELTARYQGALVIQKGTARRGG